MKFGLHIYQMNLRVSGLNREQGQRLGETVIRRLADLDFRNQHQQVHSLSVNVRSDSTSVERLADQIVLGIQRSLKIS